MDHDAHDPLSIFTVPPPNESPEEKQRRLEEMKWQMKRNTEIEEMLRGERSRMERKGQVRVLLVGQSESGKSTVLKNLQLSYAPRAFRAERATWTRIIYLNLVRAINVICAAVSNEMGAVTSPVLASAGLPALPATAPRERRRRDMVGNANTNTNGRGRGRTREAAHITTNADTNAYGDGNVSGENPDRNQDKDKVEIDIEIEIEAEDEDEEELTDEHRYLVYRLHPLLDLEMRLRAQLAPPSDTELFSPGSRHAQEFFVRSGTAWKRSWGFGSRKTSINSNSNSNGSGRGSTSLERAGEARRSQEEVEERLIMGANRETVEVLLAAKSDMMRLWRSKSVKTVLMRRRTKLEDSAAFYLDNLERIVVEGYEPSDDDVVRARLRTVGVQEYQITHERDLGRGIPNEWIIYDVGGTRSQRAVWLPFFEHMNAIIFLAPINCFNEKLAEDRRINRLEDSFDLYKTVVSSHILKNVQIILFLNKMDLLAQVIENGVQLRKYVTSYNDRPNDVQSISKYFQRKFRDISRQFSPHARPFYSHLTSAIDIAATAVTLNVVRDGILRSHLENADML